MNVLSPSFFLAPKKQKAECQDEENSDFPYLNLYTLPWQKSFQMAYDSSSIGNVNLPQCEDINPGEYVLRALFTEFTVLAERKIERLLKEPLVSLNQLYANIQTMYHANSDIFTH